MTKSFQLSVTVLCIVTLLCIGMAMGQRMVPVRCHDMLTWGECTPLNCAFVCILKRQGKGGCIQAYDSRPACVCYYTCLRPDPSS
ncbi:PREDICTED: putative defensin-like protein 139 [Camelina sativa]|uniref:Defensin-like protein 139 n=1 Tax=Camelina sativa TaxID=90675 RepID=A0ABM1QHK6_CAMSA|nr:PREDICTED: putative defensin-like protein 139 [Camelina sativa]